MTNAACAPGYYPFEESPARIPPIVRKPPYLQTQVKCPGVDGPGLGSTQEQTLDNLCGDLNKGEQFRAFYVMLLMFKTSHFTGYLPVNPIGQNVLGVSYPFELIKNKTLDFFSKTLPILKADDTLPKVAKYQDSHIMYNPTIFNSQPNARIKFYENNQRKKREASPEQDLAPEAREGRGAGLEAGAAPRESRGWCEDSFGVFCMLFNAVKGDNSEAEATDRLGQGDGDVDTGNLNSLDQPMTPCPSAVEYVTPVFAKNYQVRSITRTTTHRY